MEILSIKTSTIKTRSQNLNDNLVENEYISMAFIQVASSTYGDTDWDSTIGVELAIEVKYSNRSTTWNGSYYDLYHIERVRGKILQHTDSQIRTGQMELRLIASGLLLRAMMLLMDI